VEAVKAGPVFRLHRLASRLAGNESHAARFLRNLLGQNRRLVILAFVANLLAALFDGSTLVILTAAVETLVGEAGTEMASTLGTVGSIADKLSGYLGQEGLFLLLVGLAVGSQLLTSGLQFGGRVATAHLRARVERDVRSRLFGQLMGISYGQVSSYKIGDLTSYLQQVDQVGYFVQMCNSLLITVLTTMVYIGTLFWLSWPVTLISLVALGLLSLVTRRIVRYVRRAAHAGMRASVEANELVTEFLQGLRLVHTFARTGYATDKVDAALEKGMLARRRGLIWSGLLTPLVEALVVIGVGAFLVGGYYALGEAGRESLSRGVVFVFVLYRLMPRFGMANNTVATLNDSWPAMERLADILRTDDKVYMADGQRPFEGLRQQIEFRHVSLQYDGSKQEAVQDLCLRIPRGSMIALVGESGAGKSSTLNLMLRLYDPSDGEILVDGVSLGDLCLGTWRARVGIVDQDTFIFNASLRDNIAFGKLDATEDEIVAAAKAAHAHDFIVETAQGYETVVGERGFRLSGGQRQRIAIARAILRSPEILILDEATSDLDSQSERLIQEALSELRQDRTVVAIAHRLSTVAMADQILVLDRGRVVEQGTHEELLALDGHYARFWLLQSKVAQE
jgi:subfamily B ATP-binding cassette protein MsbA